MSAIAGVIHLDGRPGHERILSKMLDRMAHRGPHGRGERTVGRASFGHLLLQATEESKAERLPIVSGPVLVTAATRLDNRSDLASAASQSLADPDGVLLLPFLRAPERLLGDFAYAAWDEAAGNLLGVRDHFGVKPFYYFYRPGRIFIFASQIRALFAHPDVPRRLNQTRLAQYWLGQLPDQQITFYKDIFRLPAGHALELSLSSKTNSEIRLRRYWSLDSEREIEFKSEEAYADAFREHFTRAVQRRLRTPFKVGFQLSGGLDSTAIACVGRDILREEKRLPAYTYSDIFPTVPASDESAYIESALAQEGFAPSRIEADRFSPLGELDLFLEYDDEGNYNTNSYLVFILHRRMAADGVRVCLDGFDGDTTVGHGCFRLGELARRKDWGRFHRELKAYCERGGWDRRGTAYSYVGPGLTHLLRSGNFGQYLRDSREAAPFLRSGWLDVLNKTGVQPMLPAWLKRSFRQISGASPEPICVLLGLIDPQLAASMNLRGLARAFESQPTGQYLSERAFQLRLLQSGGLTGVLERYDYLAGHFQMENRHPFMDRELIEFCLALPSSQKLANGFTRSVLRRALAHTLPEKIAQRPGKGDLTESFRAAFLRRDRPILEEWIAGNKDFAGLFDQQNLRDLFSRAIAGEATDAEQFILFRVLTSAQWLRKNALGFR